MTRTLSMIPADTMMIARVPAVPSIFVPRFGCVLMRRRMTTSQPVNSMASARVDAVPSVSAAKICSGALSRKRKEKLVFLMEIAKAHAVRIEPANILSNATPLRII